MRSPTHGVVTLRQIVESIHAYVREHSGGEFKVIVGTDSQNFSKTKTVTVIAFLHAGKGGRFFYEVSNVNKLRTVREKLHYETQLSIHCMDSLMNEFEDYYEESGFDYTELGYCIHVDAGNNGKSGEFIPEVVGWIAASGYSCEVKPCAPIASVVADKVCKSRDRR